MPSIWERIRNFRIGERERTAGELGLHLEHDHQICMNCKTPLTGPFCHVCGQKDDDYRRPFAVLGSELMSDWFQWDSRIVRSIVPFIFMPGTMTRAFIAGRRGHYVSPLRLYIVFSLLFFISLSLLNVAILKLEVNGLEAALMRSQPKVAEVTPPDPPEAPAAPTQAGLEALALAEERRMALIAPARPPETGPVRDVMEITQEGLALPIRAATPGGDPLPEQQADPEGGPAPVADPETGGIGFSFEFGSGGERATTDTEPETPEIKDIKPGDLPSWPEIAKLPPDQMRAAMAARMAYERAVEEETRAMRISQGLDPETGEDEDGNPDEDPAKSVEERALERAERLREAAEEGKEAGSGLEVSLRMFVPLTEDEQSQAQIPQEIVETFLSEENADGEARKLGERARNAVNIALADPRVFNRIMNEWLPRVMLVLVPLLAFLLSILYGRRKRLRQPVYLVDNLVFSLHFHAFMFFLMTVLAVKARYFNWAFSGGQMAWFFFGAILLYLFAGMRSVYGQGYIKTTLKFLFLATLMLTIYVTTMTGILIWGLISLGTQASKAGIG